MQSNQLNKTSCVLFDLDGTLLDTADDLGAALNHVLAKYNMPLIPAELYRPIASDGALGLLNLGFADKIAEHDYDTLREEFLTYYHDNIATHTRLYHEVDELITTLEQQNIPWGIVTNKPEGLTRKLLPHFPALNTSKVLIGGDTLAERKPHPLPLLHACKLIDVAPENGIYVGDAMRDIEAGNRAGMLTVIAQWGYIKAGENIDAWQANEKTSTPLKIVPFIK